MRRSASALLTLLLSTLALAAPTADPEPLLQLNNFCPYSLFISDANPKNQTPPIFELATGTAYIRPIVGSGNVLGVSRIKDYYTKDASKLILGTTIANGQLWWTVAPLDGDPFQGEKFNITTPKKTDCGNTTSYDGEAHNCKVGQYKLTFNPCFQKA